MYEEGEEVVINFENFIYSDFRFGQGDIRLNRITVFFNDEQEQMTKHNIEVYIRDSDDNYCYFISQIQNITQVEYQSKICEVYAYYRPMAEYRLYTVRKI